MVVWRGISMEQAEGQPAAKRARTSPRETNETSEELNLALVDSVFTAQSEQVSGCFLVVPGLVVEQFCEAVLPELLKRHTPQEIVYKGNGDEGTSYTNSWKISTYLVFPVMSALGVVEYLIGLKRERERKLARSPGFCSSHLGQPVYPPWRQPRGKS